MQERIFCIEPNEREELISELGEVIFSDDLPSKKWYLIGQGNDLLVQRRVVGGRETLAELVTDEKHMLFRVNIGSQTNTARLLEIAYNHQMTA